MYKLLAFLIIAFTFMPVDCYSQRMVWNVYFDTQFDNREYNSSFSNSQTLFGAKLTSGIGLSWGKNSALLIGATMIEEFGAKTFEKKPEMLLYYRYDSPVYAIFAGRFSRKALIGKYSNAFFSDSVRFFDANVDGMLLQYKGDGWYAELGFDWDSRQSKVRREKFMIFSSALHKKGIAYGGYNFSMYHHAMVTNGSGVVDNVWVMPFAGIDLGGRAFFDRLSLEVGWLQAFQNDRSNEEEYVKPGGVHIEAQIEKYKFGILNTLFLGDCMMPYYERYGSELYRGDSFYSTTNGGYNRLEVYWKPLRRGDIDLKIASVHHYDGCVWSWQQLVSFTVNLNDMIFARKRK
ncbi:hypothetical protein EZS27_023886 [termite gut metagenome]|uniref:Uncharacterized protein n=1 Tax=termite gut metagenome TaxID=433724 RepID=A0A5J4QYS7_9ZZZZ